MSITADRVDELTRLNGGYMPGIAKLYLPTRLISYSESKPYLSYAATSVIAGLHYEYGQATPPSYVCDATVRIGINKLMGITGLSDKIVQRGIKELIDNKWIVCKRTAQANVYTLLNPDTGEPLVNHPKRRKGHTLLHSNGIQYFCVPKCIFSKGTFAKLTIEDCSLYIALCWIAGQKGTSKFETSAKDLCALSDISHDSLRASLENLESNKLVSAFVKRSLRDIEVSLCNPISEVLFIDVLEAKGEKEIETTPDQASPSAVLGILQKKGIAYTMAGDECKFLCPFHRENTPSFSYNVVSGLWYCHGACKKGGATNKLIRRLTGSPEETERYIYQGKETYVYHYGSGRPSYMKIRTEDKGFFLKLYRNGKWINSDGKHEHKPRLYEEHLLRLGRYIPVITEGEKDANTVTRLGLRIHGQDTVGTTSGGASSWNPDFARKLALWGITEVIIFYDCDEPGRQYLKDVAESLTPEGIRFKAVGFGDAGVKDITDYVNAGHNKEEVESRIEAARWSDGYVEPEPVISYADFDDSPIPL